MRNRTKAAAFGGGEIPSAVRASGRACSGRRGPRGLFGAAAALVLLAGAGLWSLARADSATEDRLRSPGWWPTKADSARDDYVGPEVCATCHPGQAHPEKKNGMAFAGMLAKDSDVLQGSPELHWKLGPYRYRIERQGDTFRYSVSDQSKTISEPLGWAMGHGLMGQTYVYLHQGTYFESRVSYFAKPKGLDLTIGHSRQVPGNLYFAQGNPMFPKGAKACFACHMTAAVIENRLEPERLIPGVTCEACHGPGAKHVAAISEGEDGKPFIINPRTLKTGDLNDFCGACHRTWWDVKLLGFTGLSTVRFQPYRIEQSACWNPDDARISCLACHDPHGPVQHQAEFYDAKCLACHQRQAADLPTRERPGPGCPQAGPGCTKCHMPKVELPQAHFEFADHRIRVARPGEPYPE